MSPHLSPGLAILTPGDPAVTATIVEFLQGIGLEVRPAPIEGATLVPGITIEAGAILFDPGLLFHPGDLLHEAGHLAVKTAAERGRASRDVGHDPAEEMMAIGWSYAALRHLNLAPEVVFHPAGYCGGSQSLIENFAAGRYLSVPMLQWIGLTFDERRARELGVPPYPAMTRWLRES